MSVPFIEIDKGEKDPQTYAIIGAAMEVHRRLGAGFLEAVYQEALALEFTSCSLPYRSEVELPVFYKGQKLSCRYRADFICFDRIIVELKALKSISAIEEAQIINYLKATQMELGLLLNFGQKKLEFKRFIFSNTRKMNDELTTERSE